MHNTLPYTKLLWMLAVTGYLREDSDAGWYYGNGARGHRHASEAKLDGSNGLLEQVGRG